MTESKNGRALYPPAGKERLPGIPVSRAKQVPRYARNDNQTSKGNTKGRAMMARPLVFVVLMRYISLTPSTKALSLRERLG
jgi:hypothetical protein